jgi:PAS domain S-box-containing protein
MPRSPLPDQSPDRAPAPRTPPLLLAVLVFLAALLVTFVVAENARRTAAADLANTFDYRAHNASTIIVRRMAVYEQVLLAARGYLRGGVDISRADFATYYDGLHLTEQFPGIEALGVASIIPPGGLAAHIAAVRAEGFPDYDVRPPGARAVVTAISHIEPFAGRNLRAFGYDMFSEPLRRAAMEAARDSGRVAVTGKVTLVQENSRADGTHPGTQSGFLMYAAVYRAGLPHATVAQRRAAVVGWVYAPFRMNDLIAGLGGEHASDLEVEVFDGARPDDAGLMYRSPGARTDPAAHARFSYQTVHEHAGRAWTVRVRSGPGLEKPLDRRATLTIGVAGIGLGLLLALVVWLLATERRRALQLAGHMTLELRASRDRIEADRERVRLILRNAYDAFIAFDADGRISEWNVQASTLFGWREDEAIGRAVFDLLPPARRDAMRAALAAFERGAGCALLAGPTEMTALTCAGESIAVEIAVTALPGRGGITAFVRDIRPRKQAEERERQRQQRLEEARAALLRAQKLEAVGQMTGGVAHDFNNILHIVGANVQLMLRGGDDHARRLRGILDAVERGKKLTTQLLAFARRQPLHPSVVDLAQLIERMDDLLQRAAGSGVAIRFDIAPGLWTTLVDPNQFENVILNLVINARDAMADGGTITIALANLEVAPHGALADTGIRPGAYVTIAVSDTGSGMPPDVMERAFEPFFTTKPEGKGTGLGLAMAHGFVKQSGGHTRIASEAGVGTTVTIYLPRAVEEASSPVQ